MTQDDIDNGRLVCAVGIAPFKPAKFVSFRIQQKPLFRRRHLVVERPAQAVKPKLE